MAEIELGFREQGYSRIVTLMDYNTVALPLIDIFMVLTSSTMAVEVEVLASAFMLAPVKSTDKEGITVVVGVLYS